MVNFVVFSSYKTSFQYPNNYKLILSGSSTSSSKTIETLKNDDYFRDDQGENISIQNPYYSEYSSIYWVWKNYDDYDYISWNHYRRFFVNTKISRLYYLLTGNPKGLSSSKVFKILNSNGVILSKRLFLNVTVEEQYGSAANLDDYQTLREVINEKFYDYLECFEEVSNSYEIYPFNMFILCKIDFQNYCEWIFSVFKELTHHINPIEYNTYQKRVYGYLAERLLYVYFKKNGKNIHEYTVINTEASFLTRIRTLFMIRTFVRKYILRKNLKD